MVVYMCGGFGSIDRIWIGESSTLREQMLMRVIKVICSVSKRVDFQFSKEILRDFLKEPINDHATFYPTLAMEDEYDLCVSWFVELFLDDCIAVSDVSSGIVKVTLDETLDHIK